MSVPRAVGCRGPTRHQVQRSPLGLVLATAGARTTEPVTTRRDCRGPAPRPRAPVLALPARALAQRARSARCCRARRRPGFERRDARRFARLLLLVAASATSRRQERNQGHRGQLSRVPFMTFGEATRLVIIAADACPLHRGARRPRDDRPDIAELPSCSARPPASSSRLASSSPCRCGTDVRLSAASHPAPQLFDRLSERRRRPLRFIIRVIPEGKASGAPDVPDRDRPHDDRAARLLRARPAHPGDSSLARPGPVSPP